MSFGRLILTLAALALLVAAPARADVIEIDADRPFVDAVINGVAVRLEVNSFLPEAIVLNPEVAERARVRRLPAIRAGVSIDGGAMVVGKIGRPSVTFGADRKRSLLTAWFSAAASERADGVIGMGGLPYDRVVLRFREGTGRRMIGLPFEGGRARMPFAELDAFVFVDLQRQETQVARRIGARIVDSGAATVSEGLAPMRFVLGLTTPAQRARVRDLTVEGLPIEDILIRTDEPLTPPEGFDGVVVTAPPKKDRRPTVFIGRAALAGCATMTLDRRRDRLELSCD